MPPPSSTHGCFAFGFGSCLYTFLVCWAQPFCGRGSAELETRPSQPSQLGKGACAKCLKRTEFLRSGSARLCSRPCVPKKIGLKWICWLIIVAGRPWARAAEGGIRSTEAPEHGFLGQLQTARRARRNILPSRNERVDP